MKNIYNQVTMFEDDYLSKTTGSVTQKPDIALTELIANAWDAGATRVDINISKDEGEIVIEDNGTGMTEDEFAQRWLTLGYNRIKYQGTEVKFPDDVSNINRRAYGKNGIGRHSMFCFSNSYNLETWKNGQCFKCDIDLTSGEKPFCVHNVERSAKEGHGTRLSTLVNRNLPNIAILSDVLSARFLFDPQFTVKINGKLIDLLEHKGLLREGEIIIKENLKLKIYIIDSEATAKKSIYHGVAFWVGKRLVRRTFLGIGKTHYKRWKNKNC